MQINKINFTLFFIFGIYKQNYRSVFSSYTLILKRLNQIRPHKQITNGCPQFMHDFYSVIETWDEKLI